MPIRCSPVTGYQIQTSYYPFRSLFPILVLVLVLVLVELYTVVPRLRSALLLLRPHMTWQMWVSVLLLTVRHMMREISMAAAQVLVTVICSRSGS